MQKQLLLMPCLAGLSSTAQITAIPDPAFEQELINLNIDSDGIVNGQVLTSDVENVTEVSIIVNMSLTNLTGIQDFSSLEDLTVMYTQLTALDVSNNLQLKKLICQSNMLSDIDVSANVLLEEINVGNELDLGPFNTITELDLSNNPNIKSVNTLNMQCELINLKNGNNSVEMSLAIGYTPWNTDPNEVFLTTCIQIDDEEIAQANQYPYSEWDMYDPHADYIFSENCALKTQDFTSNNTISVYPNPTSDILYVETSDGVTVDKAVLYDISGRAVKEFTNTVAGISVAGLAKGMYVIQVLSGNTIQTQKIILE
jgi:hypothetical protein